MGVQCSCDKSAENCADKVVDKFRAVETVLHTAENGYDYSTQMLHESLPNQELVRAAMEGRERSVAWQLERGAFIEARRPFKFVFEGDMCPKRSQANVGLTPLMHAALGGHAEACAVLVTAGAEVNAEDEDRMRPLHFAAKAGSLDVFRLLLRARADANCQDIDGLTPLAQLASWSKCSKADFEALLTTESGGLLPLTEAGTATAEAAAAAVAVEATATCGIPKLEENLPLLDREPTLAEVSAYVLAGALDDSNTCALPHVPDCNLAVMDSESSDETACPECLPLQEPNWMVRELTLLPADSLHIAGEGGAEANSLQDGLTEVDELHLEANVQISELLPADSLHIAGEGGEEANSMLDGLTEVDELHNEAVIETFESMPCQHENGASWAPL